ncbi:caspase family protein [Methylobacterium sp. SD21]|uniref:caspase family protein n=1 Tax=Methylobacterium litchii TaxID=3138810 RepID=UPI00313F0B2F
MLALAVEAARAAPVERRVAFVVGNAAYQRFPSLPNPRNDAEDVTSSLKKAGFQIFGGTDLTREALRDQLRQFARAAQGADAALAYYAGHGLQYKGRNYIVPIDAKLQDEFDLEYETVRVDDIVGELNRADGARILILDACRNLPLKERSNRNPFDTGLAKISGRGLVVAYATQANALAYDGAGRNSIFTSAFLKVMDEPGLDLPQFFQHVSIAVDTQSGGRQTPELSLSYPGKFTFNRSETDRDVWHKIRGTSDAVVLRDFIARYPESDFVELAKLRLKLHDDWNALGEQLERRKKDAEARRIADLAARDSEAKRRADEARQRKAVEEQAEVERRVAEAARQAEEARLAEDARQRRLANEQAEKAKRAVEAARQAEETRQRVSAEQQAAEARRAEAAVREAEQVRQAAEARQRRVAEEQAETARRAADAAQLAEETRQRVVAEQKVAEARRAEIAAQEAEQARQRKVAEEQAERARRAAEAVRQAEEASRRARAEDLAAEAERAALAARDAEREKAAAETRRRALADAERNAQELRRPDLLASAAVPKPMGFDEHEPAVPEPGLNGSDSVASTGEAARPVGRLASFETPDGNASPAAGRPLGEARFAYNALQTPDPIPKSGADGAFPSDTIVRDRLVRETKAELGRIGCIDEMPDQVWNGASRNALARFARQAKLRPVPLEPTPDLLKDLRDRPAHFCPLLCGVDHHADGNRCVANEKPKAPEPKPVARRPKPEPKPVVQKPKPTHEVSRPKPEPKRVVQKPKPIQEAVRPKPAPVVRARPTPTPAPPQAPVATAARPISRPMMGVGF